MSLEELEFYECKDCSVKLLAGKYCIDCSKKKDKIKKLKKNKPLNTKDKIVGIPFIGAGDVLTYDTEVDIGDYTASTGTVPLWDNFTTAGNATTATGTFTTVSSCSPMDFSAFTFAEVGQNKVSGRRKTSRHK